ncbi:protein farnesyltransferase subunit beta isoform X1 [Pistacia vera]|uniref:protein farnesyltransferase subunit beta isoform X1 n=1 Tax=Pistacia vera TaxID=55513 RepID=UPI00126340D4|nr:protein farnesyltransferase subunit beta isoform X1 [Pistacia vera]
MESSSRITVTQREQSMVMSDVKMMYEIYASVPPKTQRLMMELQRDNHMEYLLRGLQQLGPSFCVLDANRPWICYWILHSIALLGQSVDAALEDRTIDFLSRCQGPDGGYAGGPGQMPHLATTYAAVNALITLGSDKSLWSIDRGKMYTFLKHMKDPSGAFRMHDEGEIDVRACYTAISVASMLNILDDDLVHNVGNYILSCQTHEGGIAGEPGSEAHGGYTFCGLATMILINEVNRLDLAALIDWVVFRQGVEGGFQGRANKLVDGCYSFWQGGVFALLQRFHSIIGERLTQSGPGEAEYHIDSPEATPESDISEGKESSDGTSSEGDEACHFQPGGSQNAPCPVNFDNVGFVSSEGLAEREPLFHSIALQRYILLCSQDPGGGLKDKPRKSRDYYHTCYCLSGLSVCQYSWLKDEDASPLPRAVLGPHSNLLEPIHPIFNVVLDRYREAHEFFSRS